DAGQPLVGPPVAERGHLEPIPSQKPDPVLRTRGGSRRIPRSATRSGASQNRDEGGCPPPLIRLVGDAQHEQRAVHEKHEVSPGRRSRAASGTHRYGSHQMLAPYSLIARSKLSSASGTASASPWTRGKRSPNSSWKRWAASSCASEELGRADGGTPVN